MKAYEIIAKIEKIIECQSEERRAEFDLLKTYEGKSYKAADCDTDIFVLAEMYRDAVEETKIEKAKCSGNVGTKKIVEKIIKEDRTERFNKAFPTTDGKYLFLDGVRAIISNDDFGIKHNAEIGQFEKCVYDIISATKGNEEINAPNIKYLTEYIKTEKSFKKEGRPYHRIANHNSGIMFDFGEGLPAVNAEYLKDILTAVGGNPHIIPGSKWCSGLYIYGNNAKAVLMPVKKVS